ncbi:hypothetical protein UNDKW_4107 [Undibacterium sp. KW1]|uniref:hypothetical protein n=1 Tax=Undibacterium sp. KW1 TaxID=2058624 RepID=UPI001331C602|nr:hypothetical protein [Undibacterium sp. KW1]BBB62380.1 hypothetical protein UNDKW_4107 [Undibacterium sp. KW1]
MDEASWIQFAYPDTTLDWSGVTEEALLQLVRKHEEPNCAGLALGELRSRKHPAVEELCLLLIHSPHADQWLQASALSTLLSNSPMKGFDVALEILMVCNAPQLTEIIEAANYEYQGDLQERLFQHPLISGLKKRLQEPEMQNLPFADLFVKNFS